MFQNVSQKRHYSETCFLHAPDIKNSSFWDPRTLKFMLLAGARCIFTPFHVFHTFLKNVKFCLKNDIVLGHLDGLKRSKNHHENQAYFWSHFGGILDLILGPVDSILGPKWYQNSAHGPRGVQSGHFGSCWTSFWSILGLILDKFRTNLSDVSTIIADISRYSRY